MTVRINIQDGQMRRRIVKWHTLETLGIGFAELIYQYINIVFTVKHIINDLITLSLAVNKWWNIFKKHLTTIFSEFDTEKNLQ